MISRITSVYIPSNGPSRNGGCEEGQTYDWTDPGAIGNTFEIRIDDGDWFLTADLKGERSMD